MCVLASFLFWGPLWFATAGMTLRTPRGASLTVKMTSAIARYLAYSNVVDIVVAYGFVAIALLMLAHCVVWPRLKRPIIALRLAGISFNRKWLWGVGITMLALATGWLPALVHEFIANPQSADFERLFRSLAP
jgi:hypothetical protein